MQEQGSATVRLAIIESLYQRRIMLSKIGPMDLHCFARTFLDFLPGLGQHNGNGANNRLLKRLEPLVENAIGEFWRDRACGELFSCDFSAGSGPESP